MACHMTNIPDLASMLTEQILSRERKFTPRSSPRLHASWIGHRCARWCYYKRTAGELETEAPDSLRLVFREGNLVEADIYATLSTKPLCDAVEVVATQIGEPLPGNISGACDAVVRIREGEGWSGPYVLEIKSVNPNLFDQYQTVADFDRHSWSARYVPQVHIYNRMADLWLQRGQRIPGRIQGAIFILKCKSSGAIKQLYVPRDEAAEEALIAKAEMIERCVAAAEPPERLPWGNLCAECSFLHVCMPVQPGEPTDILVDGAVQSACRDIVELAPILSDVRARYESARELVRTRLEAMGIATGKPPKDNGLACGRSFAVLIGDPPTHEARLSKTQHQCRLTVKAVGE